MDEQERRETNEAEMDEQEKRETTEAEEQYSEAGKKHTEAEKLYAEAERQHNEAGDQYAEAEKPKARVPEAVHWGGLGRSSDEGAVMALEQRPQTSRGTSGQPGDGEEPFADRPE